MSPSLPQPHVIQQFRSLIWHALDNSLSSTALFTAERLHAYDPKGPDSVHLLALCMLRDGQYRAAEALTKNWLRHVGCAFVFAQCCLKLGGGKEKHGISALEGCRRLWSGSSSWNQHTDTERRAIPDAAAILCLMGKLCHAINDLKKAIESFVAAVKLNPFLWDAFTGLCDTGVNLRVNNIFKQSQEMVDALKIRSTSGNVTAPEDVPLRQNARNGSENMQHDPFMSTAVPKDRSDLAYNNHPSFFNRLNEGVGSSAVHATELETPTAQSSASSSHDNLSGGNGGIPEKPPPILRKTRAATADIHGRKLTSRSTRDINTGIKRAASSTNEDAAQLPARRSTRLNAIKFTSKLGGTASERDAARAAKEREREARRTKTVSTRSKSLHPSGNATVAKEREKERGASEDVNVRGNPSSCSIPQPRRVTRATTAQATAASLNKGKRKATSEMELTRRGKKQMQDAATRVSSLPAAPTKLPIDPKKEEAQLYILELYRKLGAGYFSLSRYHCSEALQAFNSLPLGQKETPWVQCQVGKAYYEMANYSEAEQMFLKVRQLDSVRTRDMEVFSTILWHQRKDVELSFLAHELIELDRSSPESWCALGNCFSLQRDHDQALKCFKRATQLNPKFAYAFTLQGHEHVSNEEYEKALTSYRCATAADQRHYNAWYGLGKVHEKMGKYDIANTYFKNASKINPTNAVLVCCIGTVLEKMKDFSGALAQYNSACKMAPRSALSRFKKARTLMSLREYKGALDELMILKDLAPDEANVHFLLGRLYKSLHDKTNAIKHLTIALNLDPKAGHLIKEVIENLDDDDEAYNAEDSEVYKLLDADQ